MLLLCAAVLVQSSTITFTGNVLTDFPLASPSVLNVLDLLDVGTPPAWPFPASGWDIAEIRFHYSVEADVLSVGVRCFVVCGDAGEAKRIFFSSSSSSSSSFFFSVPFEAHN
jgi:hypothetical protein